MKLSRVILSLVASTALALAACSGGDVILEIDIHSFLTESGEIEDPHTDYGVLALPVPITVRGLELVSPNSVEIVDAIDDLTLVRSARLIYRMEAVNREGSADGTVHIKLASTRAGLDDSASSLTAINVRFLPATTTPVQGSIELDDDALALFEGDEVWISASLDLTVGSALAPGDSIAGRLWVRGLDARIVANEDFF